MLNRRACCAQLESVEARYEELSIRITLPEVIADTQLFAKLMREHSDLAELNEIARNCRALAEQLDEANELLNDPDMAEMAREEVDELEPKLREALHAARVAMLPKDPDDRKNAVLEVRAGAGGDEAGLFGAELLRMYQHYADRQGWKWELIEDGSTELGGIKESVALISGKNVFEKLKFESGVHRVQRVPVTESSRAHPHLHGYRGRAARGRGRGSRGQIPTDLRIDTYRASGAGGQHVNTHRLRRAHHPPAHGHWW